MKDKGNKNKIIQNYQGVSFLSVLLPRLQDLFHQI